MTGSDRSITRVSAMVVAVLITQLVVPIVVAVGPASADATVKPVADSYVDASDPTANFGTLTVLRSDGLPSRIAYLRFDVTGAGPATTAVLDLHAETGGVDLTVHAVADTTWDESTINANNAPPVGAALDSVVGVQAGLTYSFDVSAHVTGDGTYSFAVVTADDTAIRMSSREGAVPPLLSVPAPPSPSPFLVTQDGPLYVSTSQTTGLTYTGTLKQVVESSVVKLRFYGGGEIDFDTGTFDLGVDHFELDGVDDVTFAGQGMNQTTIVNNTSAAEDTEPFDVVGANNLVVRDLTVEANGAFRSTSDALDFDNADNILVERVRVTASRGRGIVFDGKGDGWTAVGNQVRDCEIDGVPSDGIEFLAASNGVIDGCTITNAAGHGIQLNKSSTGAAQPNKPSNDNIVRNNTIDQSGQDGINVNGSDDNLIHDNTVTNSSDVSTSRSGIRVQSSSGVGCNDNVIARNVSTDNQTPKTQRYGVDIASALCNDNVIDRNTLTGNLVGDFRDLGTDTIFDPPLPVMTPGFAFVTEGDIGTQTAVLSPTLSKPSLIPVTVNWMTVDYTATSPDDFIAASGTIRFEPGETTTTQMIEVVGDLTPESEEVGLVVHSGASGTKLGGFFGLGFLIITDND